jgi:soluble lytic murein transglycosylase
MADRALNRRAAAFAAAALSCALVAGSCTTKVQHTAPQVNASASAPDAQPPEPVDAGFDAPEAAAGPSVSWVEAVRVARWRQAAAALDALEEKERSQPLMRYVRARVALELAEHERAVGLLQGLETTLRELQPEIAFYRAEAQIHAGPSDEAARYFAAQTGCKSLVKAALAWEKAGQPKQARDAVDRAIKAAGKRTDAAAVDARALRARLAEAAGDKALAAADLRFVARHDPARAETEDIGEAIARLDPARALTAPERIDRAHRLAKDGNAQAASEELERAAKAPGRPSAGAMAYARAKSLYLNRSQYVEAAEQFELAARLDRTLAAEATWYAARAWARADQNPRAAARYRALAQSYPRTAWGEKASYQLARIDWLEARWAEAARSYGAYLSRYPRGGSVEPARYEHAVSLLLAGRPEARKALAELEKRSTDALNLAHLKLLQGHAAQRAGDADGACALWSDIIRELPLSWPALVASARLAASGRAAPPMLQPPPPDVPQALQVSLPQPAAMLRSVGLDRDASEWLEEREGQWSSSYGSRSGEAMCVAYGMLSEGRRRYRVAQRAAPARWLYMRPTEATRWSWDCLFPRPHPALVSELETRESLPQGFMHAIMRQESAFDPEARSPAGALGLMQLLPTTAQRVAQEFAVTFEPQQVLAPAVNLELAARYLGKLSKNMHGSLPLVAASYNAGPSAVGRWLQRAGDLPVDLWVARIPYGETRRYVWKVMGNHARYQYAAAGETAVPALGLKLPEGIQVGVEAY